MTTRARWLALGGLLGFATVWARDARADATSSACLEGFDKSQRLRRQGKLTAARNELRSCAQQACPDVIQTKCVQWAQEVEAALPSIVVSARGRAGDDHTNASLWLDGVQIAPSLSGTPVDLDPGQHTVAIVPDAPGVERMVREVQVAESEKGRLVTFEWPSATTDTAPTPTSSTPSAKTSAYVFFGVSAAALAAFGYFGITALSTYLQDAKNCSPTCDPSGRGPLQTKFIVADVSLGVAILSGALGTWLFLQRDKPAAAGALTPAVEIMPGGARGLLGMVF